MNKEIVTQLHETIADFTAKNKEYNNKIQANNRLYSDIFKQFKERAKVIDKNNAEIINYLNSLNCKDLKSSRLGLYNNFINYTCFHGFINFELNSNNLFQLTLRIKSEGKEKQTFIKFEDFIDFCTTLTNMSYDYIQGIYRAVEFLENNFIKELYKKLKYLCEDINKAYENTLSTQLEILKKIGLDKPRTVTKYKITIEVIE